MKPSSFIVTQNNDSLTDFRFVRFEIGATNKYEEWYPHSRNIDTNDNSITLSPGVYFIKAEIEVIKINGKVLPIDIENKEVRIDLGKLAEKDKNMNFLIEKYHRMIYN